MSEQVHDTFDVQRPPVTPRTFSKPYWEGTRAKKLMIQFDPRAKKYQHFPRPNSIYDGRGGLEWHEVSGKGEVFTWTVARRGPPIFRGQEPYLVANVTLDVGVNVIANLVHCELDEVKIGLKVKPYWHPMPDGTHILMFQPDR